MKILITKFKTFGDVLLLTPLIRNLKVNIPNSSIDILVEGKYGEILKNNPYINKIHTLENQKNKFGFFLNLKNILKIFNHKYNLCISTDRGDKGAIISLFSRADIRIGRKSGSKILLKFAFTNYFQFHGDRHVIDLNLDPLRILNLKITDKGLDVFSSTENDSKILDIVPKNKKLVQIHPTSFAIYKSLNDKAFSEIIDYIELELDFRVLITAGKNENEINKVQKILKLCKSKPLNLSGKLSLSELIALNRKVNLVLTIDTLLMHISSANDKPIIAFFGPTSVANWGPWDKNEMISPYKRQGGIQTFGKHTVISQDRECIPCSNVGCMNSGLSDCLLINDTSEIKYLIYKSLQ